MVICWRIFIRFLLRMEILIGRYPDLYIKKYAIDFKNVNKPILFEELLDEDQIPNHLFPFDKRWIKNSESYDEPFVCTNVGCYFVLAVGMRKLVCHQFPG